jgi:hypothetical protein
MLETRKFMRRKKNEEVFKDADDEAVQKNWRRMLFLGPLCGSNS